MHFDLLNDAVSINSLSNKLTQNEFQYLQVFDNIAFMLPILALGLLLLCCKTHNNTIEMFLSAVRVSKPESMRSR